MNGLAISRENAQKAFDEAISVNERFNGKVRVNVNNS